MPPRANFQILFRISPGRRRSGEFWFARTLYVLVRPTQDLRWTYLPSSRPFGLTFKAPFLKVWKPRFGRPKRCLSFFGRLTFGLIMSRPASRTAIVVSFGVEIEGSRDRYQIRHLRTTAQMYTHRMAIQCCGEPPSNVHSSGDDER